MNFYVKFFCYKLLRKSNVEIARKLGVKIGEKCLVLSNPYKCFGSEPYLVELGNHVEITSGVKFITHDGGVWVLREQEEFQKVDKFGKITIGNNVFVGLNSIIMPNVTIGDNCVIGAGSLVNKNIPSGEVWAGVPAKKICTLEEYKNKSMSQFSYTKGLSFEEKKQALQKTHPEWF
jgi:acetyltransferase-like isoleucine patch superfamily enzyme